MAQDYVLIDPTKLFIPAKVAIVDEFKQLLESIKTQKDKLYKFSISESFKQFERTHNENEDAKKFISTTLALDDMLQSILDNFKLLNMKGGGLFSKSVKKPEFDMDMLLEDLIDEKNGENIKFNAILTDIVQVVSLFNKNEIEKALLFFDHMKTKIAIFHAIVNKINKIIKDYNNIPSKLKNGGKKRRTRRAKKHSRRTKRRRL
jgi:hypothetical protein